MTNHFHLSATLHFLTGILLVGCSQTRQIAVDYPAPGNDPATQASQSRHFQALPGFNVIDGDDYYVRMVSEFDFKGNNVLKSDCSSLTPSYQKNDLSSALIFNVHNTVLKLNQEAVGFSYQASTGQCNYKFDTKKLYLTPWMRLDAAKETTVDYSYYSSENSNIDVVDVVNKVSTASNLLALTGVGMGVAVIGQFAGHWFANQQQTAPTPPVTSGNHRTESHTLPTLISFSNKNGTLTDTTFKVYTVAEGGISILGEKNMPIGELKVYPELTSTLLLKTTAENIPDAHDLSLQEIVDVPIKATGNTITVRQLIDQSKHPDKPNLKPNWNDYDDVNNHCRKLKLFMKDLGFNKFDRNAVLYYFLANNNDWKNYTTPLNQGNHKSIDLKIIQNYRSKNFASCLAPDDYSVMKTMGLMINTSADWQQIETSSQKNEQFFLPLKAIERQLLAVLKNPNPTEMASQIYPLLTTKNGMGTVLLQNHLGDFGLEKLLNPIPLTPATQSSVTSLPPASSNNALSTLSSEGSIVTAQQMAAVFSGLLIDELSCARIPIEQQKNRIGNIGILLFTTKNASPRTKGGALEFEFADNKINRISFQLPTYRDFEQDLLDYPEVAGCKITADFITKLH